MPPVRIGLSGSFWSRHFSPFLRYSMEILSLLAVYSLRWGVEDWWNASSRPCTQEIELHRLRWFASEWRPRHVCFLAMPSWCRFQKLDRWRLRQDGWQLAQRITAWAQLRVNGWLRKLEWRLAWECY